MKTTMLTVSKFSLCLYLIYIHWFSTGVVQSNAILYGTVFLATLGVCFESVSKNKLLLPIHPAILKMYFIFGIYSFVSGVFVYVNFNYFLSHMITFFADIVVLYDIYYVSRNEGSMEWVGKVIKISALLALIQIFVFPYADPHSGRYSLGPESNANVVGLLFVIGIFFLVYKREKIEERFLLKSILIIAFLYGIILTGSRKSLLSGGLLVATWAIVYMRNELSSRMKIRTILSVLIMFAAVFTAIQYMTERFLDTEIYARFIQLFSGTGSNIRQELYRDAFETWKDHPFFGVGFCQSIFYTSARLLSHSTYMEILSCTGIIGTLIFFVPVIRLGINLAQKAFVNRYAKNRYDDQMLLIVFVIELAMGAGQEWIYYSLNLLVMLYLSWENENSKGLRIKIGGMDNEFHAEKNQEASY